MIDCQVCQNKRYLIAERSDGRVAVECCDNCAANVLTDKQFRLNPPVLVSHNGGLYLVNIESYDYERYIRLIGPVEVFLSLRSESETGA